MTLFEIKPRSLDWSRVGRGIFGSQVCLAAQQLLLEGLDLVKQGDADLASHLLINTPSTEEHFPPHHSFNLGNHTGSEKCLMSVSSSTN